MSGTTFDLILPFDDAVMAVSLMARRRDEGSGGVTVVGTLGLDWAASSEAGGCSAEVVPGRSSATVERPRVGSSSLTPKSGAGSDLRMSGTGSDALLFQSSSKILKTSGQGLMHTYCGVVNSTSSKFQVICKSGQRLLGDRPAFHNANPNCAIARSDIVGISGVGGESVLRAITTVGGGVWSLSAAFGVEPPAGAAEGAGVATSDGVTNASCVSTSAACFSSGDLEATLSGLECDEDDHEGGVLSVISPRKLLVNDSEGRVGVAGPEFSEMEERG